MNTEREMYKQLEMIRRARQRFNRLLLASAVTLTAVSQLTTSDTALAQAASTFSSLRAAVQK